MYPTDLQDLRPSGCCGSSDDGEDSRGEGGGILVRTLLLMNLVMMTMTVTLKVT